MAEIERCKDCGGVIALIGLRHNCIPKVQTAALKETQHNPGLQGVKAIREKGGSEYLEHVRPSQPAGIKPGPSDVKLGRPRLEDAALTLRATAPWKSAGMSRTTWFRRQAEKRVK